MKFMIVFGTRPEAIKMCPLVLEMKKHKEIECLVCTTGQHKEMLRQVLDIFGVKPDYELNIMTASQTLSDITAKVLLGMGEVLEKAKPCLVFVHGDTTTSFAAALAAFYQKIPVAHVEAGLRTYDKYFPFPEEINRNLVSKIADIHFAPTEINKAALMQENITENVFVTGNTVIDAFKTTVKKDYRFKEGALNTIDFSKKVIVLTAHRRENWGVGIAAICHAVQRTANENPDTLFVCPVHPNPTVNNQIREALELQNGVLLTNPLDVQDMHNLISKCYFVLTDSGGLQEEAPHFGKPVLVLRGQTERPEAVQAGAAILAGTDPDNIYMLCHKLLTNSDFYHSMSKARNPYGDGNACERIIKAVMQAVKN